MRRAEAVACHERWWLAFVLAGCTAAVLYAAGVAADAAFALVGVGTVAALVVGPRWQGAEPRRPWRLLAVAASLFLAGALARPWVATAQGGTALLADVFTVPGYAFMIASLAAFLRARRAVERHAVIDGLIVCVAAGIATTLLFSLPAASIAGRPLVVSLLAGLYPLLDAILVLLVANLAFTTAARQPSLMLLAAMQALIFAGDLAYAVIGVSGELYRSRLLDLPFLLAFTMAGAAALHPSVRVLLRASPLPVQAWSLPRLAVIGPAVALPFVLTVTIADKSFPDSLVLGVGGALIVVLLLIRAVSAVQSHAAAQRRYEHLATHDPLTGLPNRRMLAPAVERLVASAPPTDDALVWMFFLDLDGFKLVNDSWGHQAGDELIADVARRLRAALPASAMVARVGGDEFVVVRLCGERQAMEHAKQIIDCVEQPLQVATAKVVITASIGIASAPVGTGSPATAESLMRDADTAMYRTKSQRRGTWTVFDASMRALVRERVDIEVALRSAVAQGELVLAYQPIVDLSSGELRGAEALLRWDHPERGRMAPGTFIPIAEDSHVISAIGLWVLRDAIRQLAAWRASGRVGDDFWLSINVSPRQLNDWDFAGRLADELVLARVPANRIVLEITESVMVEGGEVTEHVLRELRVLGVRIAVDDFGTGFSALGYLRRHPVTAVKIDRSFVAGLGSNAEDEEIVRAVVAMSTALGLSVVAEGVETAAQRAVLATLGVSLAQGWLWGKAIEPPDFVERWSPAATVGPGGAAVGGQAAGNS